MKLFIFVIVILRLSFNLLLFLELVKKYAVVLQANEKFYFIISGRHQYNTAVDDIQIFTNILSTAVDKYPLFARLTYTEPVYAIIYL